MCTLKKFFCESREAAQHANIWLGVPYVSDEESNDDLGGFPERRDSPMPSPLRAGKKHASTPKSRSKGKKPRDGGSS